MTKYKDSIREDRSLIISLPNNHGLIYICDSHVDMGVIHIKKSNDSVLYFFSFHFHLSFIGIISKNVTFCDID